MFWRNLLRPFSGQNLKLEPGAVFLWNAGTTHKIKLHAVITPPQVHKFNSHHRGNFKSHTIVMLLDALVLSSVLLPFPFVACPSRILNTWIFRLPCWEQTRLKQTGKSRSTAMHILSKLFTYFFCHKNEINVERDIWVSHRDAGSEVQGSELALPWNCDI